MKINVLQRTLEKSSKEILRGKQKLKNYHLQAAKKYNSMCEDLQTEANHTPIVLQLKERQHSKKDVRQAHSGRMVRSKSRQIEKSNDKKDGQTKKHDIGSLYSELMAVKAEYKKLKGSYQNLAKQKIQSNNRAVTQIPKNHQNERASKEVQKCHQSMFILQSQLQRIRKQCLRVVETQKFKNKRLQQIIHQKDLTIAYLRGQLDRQRKWPQSANTTNNQTTFYGHSSLQAHYMPSSANCSQISNVVVDQQKGKEEDSLCFSCDPSKQLESVNSLFANNEKNLKKDRFIVQPTKTNDPFTEPSQCLTFQQRDQQANQPKQMMRLPPRQAKKDQSKVKAKSNKKLKMLTQCDENVNKNGRNQEPNQKQLLLSGGFVKQRKKVSSSRKRN